jgi:DeoR/GlpR family transcriptional regulator of sugar metabolism
LPQRGRDGSVAGAETVLALAALSFDIAVVGCSGFDASGAPTDFDAEKIAVKRTAIAAARRVLLVADSGKFGRAAIERIAPPEAFEALVTDAAPPAALAAAWAGHVTVG